ncbi:hypothetical protein PO909_012680 [Leuciscus waleckii]
MGIGLPCVTAGLHAALLLRQQYQSQRLKEFRTWSRAALVIVFGNVQRIAKKFPKILAADKTTLPYKVKPGAHIKLSSDSRMPTQTLVSKKGGVV